MVYVIDMRIATGLNHYSVIWGARGGLVVKAHATYRQVAGSIPDGVIGIFQ